jgi:dTMP kinase
VLISFEGIDGCGKSTQIDLLKKYLDSKNLAYFVFREPGGTEISEKIRSLLLHDSEEMDSVTELLLFSAARSQLIIEKVKPLLLRNEIVILDRYYDSTTAYQGYGRGTVPLDSIHTLNRLASHATVPDITFYLKIDPELAQKRTAELSKDRMESAGIEFFRSVSDGYDELAKRETRFIIIEASKKVEDIHSDIIKHLDFQLI